MSARETILAALEETRSRTLWLFDRVPDEFLRRRVHSFYSPIGWHFGHIGRTEEFWAACKAAGREPNDEALSFIFADLPENPKDNRVNIPPREGIRAYLEATREASVKALEASDLTGDSPLQRDGYAWHFAIQHECQHQETIAEMLQLIQKQLPQPPVECGDWRPTPTARMIELPGGRVIQGSDDPTGYDNEKAAHEVEVGAFRLAERPVSSYEWTEFMRDGGYMRPELWSPGGWRWAEQECIRAPEYWKEQPSGWAYFGPNGLRAISAAEPVSSISHFEAEAFARWAGKRLPTESEWEMAASIRPSDRRKSRYPWGDELPDRARACYGLTDWAPADCMTHPSGAAESGLQDLAGSVWEWTSSAFLPYPRFEAYPYDGYSKDHMRGEHRVCRGGSWATNERILRSTFRNWYVPTYRQGFLGMRLAESI